MAVKEKTPPKIEQVLLDMMANSLFNANRPIDSEEINWMLVWYEAYVQAVSLNAFSGAAPKSCTLEAISGIREKLNNALREVVHVNKEHIRLHNIMTEAEIPYVILKGAASAAYYPDPLLRTMGDVDFLIDRSNVDKACKVLEEKGFKRNPKEHEKHIVYYDETAHYEMHIEPAGIPKGDTGDKIRELLKDIIEKSHECETLFGTIRVPSDFHHGLVILLHTCCHLTSEGIGLRQLCDWATFVSSFSEDDFCKIFEESLKSVGLWRFAQVLTQTSVKYLGCPEHCWVGAENAELTEGVIKDIFKNGNLGQKNSTSMQESLFLTGNGKKESLVKHFFSSINEIVYFYWNFTRKLKFLLPLGWLFFGGRYIIRSFLGKRPKINIKNIKSEATTRSDLYEEMELFKN